MSLVSISCIRLDARTKCKPKSVSHSAGLADSQTDRQTNSFIENSIEAGIPLGGNGILDAIMVARACWSCTLQARWSCTPHSESRVAVRALPPAGQAQGPARRPARPPESVRVMLRFVPSHPPSRPRAHIFRPGPAVPGPCAGGSRHPCRLRVDPLRVGHGRIGLARATAATGVIRVDPLQRLMRLAAARAGSAAAPPAQRRPSSRRNRAGRGAGPQPHGP